MASKILSIEIGTQMTRIVEMDYKVKNPKIYQFFSLPTPDDVMADGSVVAAPEFVERIKNALAGRKIKTRKIIFVMNSTRIANREVVIPLVKEKQIHNLLITNSAEFFPVDLNQYQLVHKIIEKNEKENQYKLSVLAVPNEIIASYCALAEALNLEIAALDYLGNSIAQGMLRLLTDSIKVTIKIDENASMLTIIRGDKVELQRNISYGISEACDVMMESQVYGADKTFEEALELLRSNACIGMRFPEYTDESTEEETKPEELLREEVTESFRGLVGNISRVLDYYISRNQDAAIGKIWLIGQAADCQGLDALLSNELNIRVQPLTDLPDFILNRNITEEGFRIAEYVAPIAGAIHPLNFVLETRKKDKKQSHGNDLLIPGVVCGVCVLAAAGLAGGAMIRSVLLQSKAGKMAVQIEKLQEAEDVFDEYTLDGAEYEDLKNMYRLTETPDDALPAFFGEMEEKMPSDVNVVSMTADASGVTMSLTAASKASASKMLMQLRTFTTLSDVSCPGLTDSKDDTGRAVVEFTVSCKYAGKEDTEPQQADSAGDKAQETKQQESGEPEGQETKQQEPGQPEGQGTESQEMTEQETGQSAVQEPESQKTAGRETGQSKVQEPENQKTAGQETGQSAVQEPESQKTTDQKTDQNRDE